MFEFGSLFAVDSAGSYTEALRYEIAEKDKNSTLVKVVLDVSYLKDESRMFPILIDPSIMVTGASKTYDTYVSSKNRLIITICIIGFVPDEMILMIFAELI